MMLGYGDEDSDDNMDTERDMGSLGSQSGANNNKAEIRKVIF